MVGDFSPANTIELLNAAHAFPGGSAMNFNLRMIALATSTLAIAPTLTDSGRAAQPNAIAFDAPAIVIAEPINPAVVQQPTMGGDLVRLRIPVSTYQSPEFRGSIQEYVVEIDSPHQTLRVLDFWPKNEVYSEVAGTVSVQRNQQTDRNLNFNVSAAYEPIGRGTAAGDFHDSSSQQENFERNPPMQILTSSGTIRRGYGVFFKFRPGPLPVLEGVRELSILAEVPRGWRADMLHIHMRAVGTGPHASRPQTLGESRLWMTSHREGDRAAATAATRYVNQERALRSLAAANSSRIANQALPTFWHRLGASLDVVDPKIPSDYLSQVIFSASNVFYDNKATNRLPVDVRVAVLDYWDVRNALMSLAYGSVSKPTDTTSAVQVSFNDRHEM